PSSCPSSSISKSVLTQIRNHLALSLTRVQELENQVAQIPFLKDQLPDLEAQRSDLLAKVSSAQQSGGLHDRSMLVLDRDRFENTANTGGHFPKQRFPPTLPDFGTAFVEETPNQGRSSATSTEQLQTFASS